MCLEHLLSCFPSFTWLQGFVSYVVSPVTWFDSYVALASTWFVEYVVILLRGFFLSVFYAVRFTWFVVPSHGPTRRPGPRS